MMTVMMQLSGAPNDARRPCLWTRQVLVLLKPGEKQLSATLNPQKQCARACAHGNAARFLMRQ